MDMDVSHCKKKPRLNHRPLLPEDLYECLIVFLFRVCHINIEDIYLSGEHEDDKTQGQTVTLVLPPSWKNIDPCSVKKKNLVCHNG